jgi:hypothetical protein
MEIRETELYKYIKLDKRGKPLFAKIGGQGLARGDGYEPPSIIGQWDNYVLKSATLLFLVIPFEGCQEIRGICKIRIKESDIISQHWDGVLGLDIRIKRESLPWGEGYKDEDVLYRISYKKTGLEFPEGLRPATVNGNIVLKEKYL